MHTFLYILLGFLHFIVRYTYENWVWLGLKLGASLTLQWVCGPPLVTGGLTSSVNCSKAVQPHCGHRNPSASVAEFFHLQPSLSSSLLSSFDYRREPILPAIELNCFAKMLLQQPTCLKSSSYGTVAMPGQAN